MNSAFAQAMSAGLTKQAGVLDLLKDQKHAYEALRSSDHGLGQAVVGKELFQDRVTSGAATGALTGLVGAILGGLTGLGLGAMIGDPFMAALIGALTGGSVGFLSGNAAGQTKVDKLYLAERGLDGHVPLPIRSLALPFTVGAALPIGSHLQYAHSDSGENHGSH